MAEAGDPQTHPLAVGGVVYAYTPTLDTIALDGATGKLKWRFTFRREGRRGAARPGLVGRHGKRTRLFAAAVQLSLCPGPGHRKTVFTDFGEAAASTCATGWTAGKYQCCADRARRDLARHDHYGFSHRRSAPAAPGDIRALMCTRQVALELSHHPASRRAGYETWPPDYWKTGGGANAWPGMVMDAKRGMVFGAHRLGGE